MKYLLLRDNKQSGPYSKDELVTKGLKPYDLVWLEGKSAAWRYPSEFDELKPFAPVVEEQPYDRFYKKSSAQTSSSNEYLEARSKKQTAAVAEKEKEVAVVETPVAPVVTPVVPIMEEPVVAKPVTVVPSKKIYVTMPAAYGNIAAAKKETVTPQPVAATTKEEYKAYEPVPADEVPVKKDKVTPAVKSVNEVYKQEEPVTSQWGDNGSYGQEERITILRRERKGNSKMVMRSLVAACLILGGIVIGLAISNTLSKSDRKDLESLVNQIREREKASREAANKPVDNPVENNSNALPAEDTTATPDNSVAPSISDVVAADAKNLNSSKKNKNTVGTVNDPKSTIPVSVKNTEEDMKISPAVMEDNKQKVTYKEAALESARKNIYSMVDVASNKYKVGVLGGISELYITLSNNSLYPLDQVSVEVKYFGPEKRVVKTQTLLFNDVAAGEQKTLEVPKTNRGVSVDYVITQINSKVLGLARAK